MNATDLEINRPDLRYSLKKKIDEWKGAPVLTGLL